MTRRQLQKKTSLEKNPTQEADLRSRQSFINSALQTGSVGYSRSGRWWLLSSAQGCQPCWGCWRCPAGGWKADRLGCRVSGAELRFRPSHCCLLWWSGFSLDEPSLEERSDRLTNSNNIILNGRKPWYSQC